jgi:hypothetical protein
LGRQIIGAAFARAAEEVGALARQQTERGREAFLWGGTGSRVGFLALDAMFPDLQPRPDGDLSPDAGRWFDALRAFLRVKPGAAHDPPFVLRGIPEVRYTEAELQRIESACAGRTVALFEANAIDPRAGDVVLFQFCRSRY